MFVQVLTVYLLALLAALYLLRGMMEIGDTGWKGEALLTVGVGVGVLPALAAVAVLGSDTGRWIICAAAGGGALVNGGLMVRLWKGFTPVANITLVIVAVYGVVSVCQLWS